MTKQVEGIDLDEISAWFTRNVSDVRLPLSTALIAGGHSNLTYAVSEPSNLDGPSGRRWVLRRPPLGQVLATAHDVVREHRIISALESTPVPVAPTVGVSTDSSINGAPFYVMEFVDGHVVRTADQAEELSVAARRHSGESLVDVLAEIHAVDVDSVGLGNLGRRDGYIERQLKRWYGQFERSEGQVDGGLNLPSVHEVHDALREAIPEQRDSTIVHGDYRLDNCMIDDNGDVVAVLDWEICTLGDPLADVGLLWVYWADSGDEPVLPEAAPTAITGFSTKQELMDRYAEVSGRDLSNLPYYVAFGYWKLTCIIAGVYARYAGGAMGEVPESTVEGFRNVVERLASIAADSAAHLTSAVSAKQLVADMGGKT